jgi:ABC-2 type transport system ATP-binding protein
MVLGLVRPTSGEATVLGEPPGTPAVVQRVGALVEGPGFYPYLSGRDNLRVMARYRRVDDADVDVVLDRVDLAARGRDRYSGYSLGMKQRLGVAAALLGDPDLLVLDEPTNGLDPAGMADMRALLVDVAAGGQTVVLSSHLLAEVEQMCTRVGVLDRGRLVVQDSLPALQAPTGRTVVVTPDGDRALGLLDGRVEHRAGDRLVVRGEDPATLNRLLVEAGVRVHELGAERRGLEEVVLEATTGSARDETAAVRR